MFLMNEVICDGQYWPFDKLLDKDGYRNYYLGGSAFVVRSVDESKEREIQKGEVLGTYYIKPNFPGRCSHICNGGFIVSKKCRGQGVATIMGASYVHFAKKHGYKSSLFNLVFAQNAPSIKIWEKLGFTRTGTVPRAADLKDIDGLVDAHQYYIDLEKFHPSKLEISANARNKDVQGRRTTLQLALAALLGVGVFFAKRMLDKKQEPSS